MGLALCLTALLAYSNSFGAGFTLDNKGLILDDARVHEVTSGNIDRIFRHTYWWPVGESGLYRPFTTLTYLFNYAVLGNSTDPAGYHWINFLLHAGNVLLVWALTRRLIGGQSARERFSAAFVAALWGVHPVLTESVTNIAGRADLLTGMALLGGFLMYLKSADVTGWPRRAWLAGLTIATTVGVFSKESAVAIFGVIVLFGLTRNLLFGCLAVLPPILAMVYQRSIVLSQSAPTQFPFTDNPLVDAGFWTGRLTALKVMGKYAGLLVWPSNLSCDYSYSQIPANAGFLWLPVAVAAVAAGLLLFRCCRTAFFVATSAFVVFLPTSNLIFPIGTIMAERFLYLPSIAFAAGLVWAAYRFGARWAPVALSLIIAAFAVRTVARNADWRDDLSLSEAAVHVSPRSFKAHKFRADALLASDPDRGNLDRVIEEAEKSLAIIDSLPDSRSDADAYERAAGYYFMRGDRLRQHGPDGSWVTPAESARVYRRALALFERSEAISKAGAAPSHSHLADLQMQIAKLYLRLDQPEKAVSAAVEARSLDPANPQPHRTIASLLLSAGRAEDAAVALVEGVLLTEDPGRRELLDLYRSSTDPNGCAFTPDGALNPACETVHRNLCAASRDAMRLRLATGHPDLAAQTKDSAIRTFGCEAESLERIGRK